GGQGAVDSAYFCSAGRSTFVYYGSQRKTCQRKRLYVIRFHRLQGRRCAGCETSYQRICTNCFRLPECGRPCFYLSRFLETIAVAHPRQYASGRSNCRRAHPRTLDARFGSGVGLLFVHELSRWGTLLPISGYPRELAPDFTSGYSVYSRTAIRQYHLAGEGILYSAEPRPRGLEN